MVKNTKTPHFEMMVMRKKFSRHKNKIKTGSKKRIIQIKNSVRHKNLTEKFIKKAPKSDNFGANRI